MRQFIISLALATCLFAEDAPDAPKPAEKKDDKKEEKKDDKKADDKPKESKGSVTIGGKAIAYAVKTGTMPILKEDGSPRANIFYVYYAATGENGKPLASTSATTRPIVYCFNGGPGAAAVWLHFGGLGPRKISLPSDGKTSTPIGTIAENPNSILDVADLVFIDPVGTGISRAAKGEKAEQFFGPDEDVESVGEFIRLFTTREQRWMSPKYLCGESYGGIRGSGLADYLQERHGMMLSGFICVSGVINFQTLSSAIGNDLPYLCFLPSLTSTAHYHGKLPADLQALTVEQAEAAAREFTHHEYPLALLRGRTLPASERRSIAEKLARLTGLTPEQCDEQELRINSSYFREMLLRKEGKILGRFDARVTAEDGDRSEQSPEFDPSFTGVIGPFNAMANAYLRGELGYETDEPYRVLTPLTWSFAKFGGRYVGMENHLADAMKTNPQFRLLICSGRRDLAVPPDATRYSLDHLPIPESLRKNIRMETFESGHMMYFLDADAVKLRANITSFISGK